MFQSVQAFIAPTNLGRRRRVVWGFLAMLFLALLALDRSALHRVSGQAALTGNCTQQALRLYNTGVNADGSALLTAGQTDPHYTLVNTSPVFPNALMMDQPQNIGWIANSTASAWIGPTNTSPYASVEGFYTYRTTLRINDPCSAGSAVITGNWASDNEAEILLNGVATGITTGPADFQTLKAFTLSGSFTTGLNTLDFRVRNRPVGGGGDTATGLRVELSGTVTCCGCATPPAELTDWWTFDEPSGAASAGDRSGVNNVGTYKNGPTPSPGYVANALCFDGQNDYVEVADHPEINFLGNCANDAAESFTIDTWVKTSQSSGIAVLLDKRTNAGYHLFLVDGRLGFQMMGGGTFTNFVAPASGAQFVNVADGKWHLVAVTVTRCRLGQGRLYVDGKPVLSFSPLAFDLNNTAPLNIGRRDPAQTDIYFNGCLDELEIFKRALSEDEIQALYQAGDNGKCKVNCAQKNITLNPAELVKPIWGANNAYPSVTFNATGGNAPYAITQTGGSIPPGMTLVNGVLSGMPTTPGTYTFTLTVTDADGCKIEKRYTLTIIGCALALAPTALPVPTTLVGVAYPAVAFTVAGVGGGCQPVTFTLAGGALPPGLTLSAAGQLSGTPTQVGTYTFTVKATDMCGCMTTREYRLDVRCPDLTLNPATLPNGEPGKSYTQAFSVTGGGFSPFTYTLDSGALPPGLALVNGQLTGTPTTSGTFTFKIKVTDGFGCMAMREYTLKIECPQVTIPGIFNTGVNDSKQVLINGAADAHYEMTTPGGTTLKPLTRTAYPGWATPGTGAKWVSQYGTDKDSDSGQFVYRIRFKLANCELDNVVLKGRYAADNFARISLNGGAPQFPTADPTGFLAFTNFSFTSGFKAGENTLDFLVRNDNSVSGLLVEFTEATARCCACAPITITPGSLPQATAGGNYTATLGATGGLAPYSFSATGLPSGFTLNTNGQLTGMSMTSGSYLITVMVVDAKGCMGVRRYRLVVRCGDITINPATLPDATLGTAYSQTLTANGGCGSYTFSAVPQGPGIPALPPGLALSAQGVLSGTPTACGTFVFDIKVTDKCGCMTTKRYTLKIEGVVSSISGLFNTGVDNSGALLSIGVNDPHYLVQRPASTPFLAARTFTPVSSYATSTTARWIQPAAGDPLQAGEYVYRQTFNLAGCDLSSVVITGRYAADNSAYIRVNTSTAKLAQTPSPNGFANFTNFTITASDGLVAGVNSIDFVVNNQDLGTGLIVEIAGRAKCCKCMLTLGPNPLPSGAQAVNYNTSLVASGGTPAFTFTAASALPPGLTLSSSGVLSGKPTGCGDYRFIVVVQDSRGCFARREYALTVNCYEVSASYDVIAIAQTEQPAPGFGNGETAVQQASTLSVNVGMNAAGTEQAVKFSLGFNAALLSNPRVTLSETVAEAALELNETQLAQGNLGISLTLPAGQTLPAGPVQLLNVLFDFADASQGSLTSIEFKDTPTARSVTDANGAALTPQFKPAPVLLATRAVTVSAANFSAARLAHDQIVAAFGVGLATGTQTGNTVPLPTTLLGTTIKVTDSAGTERTAPLFFVSPGQINFLVPTGTAAGTAVIRITSGDGALSGGIVTIAPTAPGLFSATANGRGLPAADVLRFFSDNTFAVERLAALDPQTNQIVPLPIDLGPENERIFISLFGTGIRGRTAQANVRVQLDEVEAPVSFAGAQGSLVGLDQINIEIPRTLLGRGLVDLVLTVDGQTANLLQVRIK